MLNIRDLIDDAKCYQAVRDLRWPDGASCPHCSASSVIKDGKDDTQPHRQRYLCHSCRKRFDDLTGTIFAGHHQPLRTWIIRLYLMGLNPSTLQIAKGLDINRSDAQAMVQLLRQGVVDRRPAVALEGEVECDEVSVVAGHKGSPEAVGKKGRPGRRRRLKGERGRGTLAKEKPPILGMLQRCGGAAIRMLSDVQRATIEPIIRGAIAVGSVVHTDEYATYNKLAEWGYTHRAVRHAEGEYARDDDGDGFCEVHVNTMEGSWSLLRSWLRPHRGISQEKLPLHLGFFEFIHNVRARGKSVPGALMALLTAPPRNPS